MADEGGEGNAELLALHRIDETCTRLQQQGNYLEALECMERGLVLRQHFFGPSSDEVWAACKTVGEMCNILAMTYLQSEDFAMVLELLKKAEILTERDDRGRAVTYNNLACYYRRQGKLHAALKYLQKAHRIEQQLVDVDNRADTHLNLCAVLSQLGRHAGALEHAQSALILLQEELFPGPLSPGAAEGSDQKKPVGCDRIAVLAIAYHNIGVEQEFMKRFDMALESYRKGVEISETHLGDSHGITLTLRNSFLAAKNSVSKRTNVRSNGNGPAKSRIGRKKTRARRKKREKSPEDEKRWNNIQKAYGEVALGIKPKPAATIEHNLQVNTSGVHKIVQSEDEEEQNSPCSPESPGSPDSPDGAPDSPESAPDSPDDEVRSPSLSPMSSPEPPAVEKSGVPSIPKIESAKPRVLEQVQQEKNEEDMKSMITPRDGLENETALEILEMENKQEEEEAVEKKMKELEEEKKQEEKVEETAVEGKEEEEPVGEEKAVDKEDADVEGKTNSGEEEKVE